MSTHQAYQQAQEVEALLQATQQQNALLQQQVQMLAQQAGCGVHGGGAVGVG